MSQPVPSTDKFDDFPPEYYEPRQQPYYQFDGQNWKDVSSEPAGSSSTEEPLAKLRVLTWNIDSLIPFGIPRMTAGLKHLEEMVSSPPAPFDADTPAVIFLQEMREYDLDLIQQAPWVQKGFTITDLTGEYWPMTGSGTAMLVDRRLPVSNAYRIPWVSRFRRDGLFVDISAPAGAGSDTRLLRLCNSHLESLPSVKPIRAEQAATAAKHLHAPGVYASVFAGDMNAIQPSDKHIAEDNNLKDAYLELGGVEGADEGFTWGYQSTEWMRLKFGCSRMDKVFYGGAITARQLVRIGVDVKVEGEDIIEKMKEDGLGGWVTDHYGLMAEMEILAENPSN